MQTQFNASPTPRIAVRTLLLVVLATSRAVFTALEQPGSSTMKHLPDFEAVGKAIQQHLGLWKEQFLPGAQPRLSFSINYPIF